MSWSLYLLLNFTILKSSVFKKNLCKTWWSFKLLISFCILIFDILILRGIDCRELIDDCVVEYGLQVLVRFALMETTSEQDDNFPSGISVRVNDKIAGLPVSAESHWSEFQPWILNWKSCIFLIQLSILVSQSVINILTRDAKLHNILKSSGCEKHYRNG